MWPINIRFLVDERVPVMSPSFDLFKATKLKDVKFQLREPKVKWVTTALQTIRPKNLQQITINFINPLRFIFPGSIDETTRLEWQALDHLLFRLWTTCSIRPVLAYEYDQEGGTGSRILGPKLMPELASRGFDVI